MISDQKAILKDIDRLGIGYQIKIYLVEQEDWQQHFYQLSLDSYQDEQLFLNYTSSITLSGLALSKEKQIKEVNLVGKDCCFSGELGLSSPKLGQKFTNVKRSLNSRWKCVVNIANQNQNLNLIIALDNGQEITWGKITFQQVKLNKLNPDKINNKPINNKLVNKINLIYNSRQLMVENLSKNKNYLFAIGNARSGTTALGRLLNFSPEICLGIERYSKDDDVSAMSFEQDFFFNVNSKGYLVRPEFYEKIRDKFDIAKYLGDKRPRFIESWKNTLLNLPEAKIVYIFRNIYDVASSYNVRANNAAQGLDKHWPTTRDFSVAVKDWNGGIQEIQNLAQFYKVYFVKYEDFFVKRSKMIHLFKYLGVNTKDQDTQIGIRKIRKTALSLQKQEKTLSGYEKEYIDSNANFEAYNKLLALYEKQFK